MRGRFFKEIATTAMVGLALVPITGCAMIDHSNTLVFGTNTNVGLQVGTDSNNVPAINVGYRRQEVAFLPLLANFKDSNGKFVPCPGLGKNMNADCKFLAKNGQSQAEDAYSVLASFGADFTAKTSAGDAEAGGGLAQYFATGAAAQILALKGGAAVVAVGSAAAKSADQPSDQALVALVKGTDVSGPITKDTSKRNELADYLQGLPDDNKYNSEADRLSVAALGDSGFLRAKYCAGSTRTECVAKIRSAKFNDFIQEFYAAYKGS